MAKKISRSVATAAIGAGIGVCISPLIEQIYPGQIIPLPDNWADNSVSLPLIIGGASLAGGLFIAKKAQIQALLLGLGVTSVASSLLKGFLTPSAGFRARAFQRRASIRPTLRRNLRTRPIRTAQSPTVARTARPRTSIQTPTSVPANVVYS